MKIFIFAFIFFLNANANERKGLTWGLNEIKIKDHVNVSCHGVPAPTDVKGKSCDPYKGDTFCNKKLPVLCIFKSETLTMPKDYKGDVYNKWSGGKVALTKPVEGTKLQSLESANNLCSQYFGKNWRMASFHDGWGWGFLAKGNIENSKRFWIYINDQDANCWN